MARAQWTDDFLTHQRQIGDPKGDEVIRTIFARQDVRALDGFMAELVANDEMPPRLPPEIQAFLAGHVRAAPVDEPGAHSRGGAAVQHLWVGLAGLAGLRQPA